MLRHYYLIPIICSHQAGKLEDHITTVIGFGCFVKVAILCCYSSARKLGSAASEGEDYYHQPSKSLCQRLEYRKYQT